MQKIKILLVDDEKDFVETISQRMQRRGQESDIALSGEQALSRIEQKVPDVVILDLKMPGMDGLEVLRQVKKVYPEVQVIILTGHGSEKHEKEARHLGAFEYLNKPIDIQTLMRHVNRAYKNKIESAMTAAAFAEAGEFETAKDILDHEKDK